MENNSIIGWIPWPVAAATAAWFGVMAWKANKNRVVWTIGGGVLGLVVTTIVLGLAQATFIPFYHAEMHPFRVKVALLAILLVTGIGWLFTGSQHRHAPRPVNPPPAPPPEPQAKPFAAAPKP